MMRVKNLKLERIGMVGFVFTALASPCCFPLFGVILTALGLGSFELFGGMTMYVFLAFVVLAFLGSIFSFLYHKKLFVLLLCITSVTLIFYNYFFDVESFNTLYFGMIGLIIVSILNYYESRIFKLMNNTEIFLTSTITCPNCGYQKTENMPTDACQYFYECTNCKTMLKPRQGDCCVYCSYGTVPCPPIQQNKKCC